MIRKEVYCPDCGVVVVAEFKLQHSADRCYKKICEKCKAEHARASSAKQKAKYKQRHYVDRNLKSDDINVACDRFFKKRHMKIEEIRPMPQMKEDTSKAVAYGESAAKRYMRG